MIDTATDIVTATTIIITTPITVILWSRNWKIFGSSVLRTEETCLLAQVYSPSCKGEDKNWVKNGESD